MSNVKSIIISGGNFVNKGAEAMLFIAVNECLKRFPVASCFLQLPEAIVKVKSMDEVMEMSLGKFTPPI